MKKKIQYADEIWRWFKEQHYFKQIDGKRLELLNELAKRLGEFYHLNPLPEVTFVKLFEGNSGLSYADIGHNKIGMVNRLSLLTFIHEFGHLLGLNQREAIDFSQEIFKVNFPRSFAKLKKIKGDLLVRQN